MKRTRQGLIFCAVLTTAGLCLWLVVRSNRPYEPVYQGRRLGYWLNLDMRASTNFDDRIAAEAALRTMDTNAVPYLVDRLEQDAIWNSRKAQFNALVDKWRLLKILKFSNNPYPNPGARGLEFLGASASPGLLRVFEESSDTNVLNAAAQTLYACEGLEDGGNFTRAFLNMPHRDPASWGQYVNEQKNAMSAAAWKRLNEAHVSQWRR